jgi:hypothetical protein
VCFLFFKFLPFVFPPTLGVAIGMAFCIGVVSDVKLGIDGIITEVELSAAITGDGSLTGVACENGFKLGTAGNKEVFDSTVSSFNSSVSKNVAYAKTNDVIPTIIYANTGTLSSLLELPNILIIYYYIIKIYFFIFQHNL